MAAFTSQRSGNWSDASATGPWYVTGTGIPSGGHGTGGVPGAGDAVTISAGNTVTVDVSSNQSVGTSGTSIDFSITGALTIAPGMQLSTTCNTVLTGTLNMGAGSILVIDSTAHAHGFRTSGSTSVINAVGTSASPAVIQKAGTNASLIGYSAVTSGSTVTYTYVNFAGVSCEAYQESSWIATNCTWTGCGQTPVYNPGNMLAGGVFKLINCRTTGTTSSYALSLYVASGLTGVTIGNRVIQGCSFDKPIGATRGWDGIKFSQCVLTGSTSIGPIVQNANGPWVLMDQCLVVFLGVSANTGLSGPITNSIIVSNVPAGSDQNAFSVGGYSIPVIAGSSSTTFTAGVTATLVVTLLPCNLPAGATLNYSGVDLTLTAAATASASSVTLNVVSQAGGTVGASAACYVFVFIGNVIQSYTVDNNNAWVYTGTGFAPTYDNAICVKNNNVLPSIRTGGGSSGSLFISCGPGGASGTNHTFVTYEHNTQNIAGSLGGIYIGDDSAAVMAGDVISLRSNAAWASSGSSAFLLLNAAVVVNDTVAPAKCGYNGVYNGAASTPASVATNSGWITPGVNGYVVKSGGTYLFSTTPLAQTTDIDTNPSFVDATRDLSKAYVSVLGQTTTGNAQTDWLDTISYLSGTSGVVATGTLVSAITSWIQAGFVPTNAAYNTTYSGDLNAVQNIGAVQGSFFQAAWAAYSSVSFT